MIRCSKMHYRVVQRDIDFTQRASMCSVINYVLEAAGRDASSRGFGVEQISARNYTWVLSRFAIEFEQQPALGDELVITTWVNECSRLVSTRNFSVENQRGEPIAKAISQWCMIDVATRQPVNLSEFAICCIDLPSQIAKPRKIDTSECESVAEHRAVYSDIDFNRHFNTLRYIDLMLNTLPLSVMERQSALRFDLQFIHESLYDDLLTIKSSDVSDTQNLRFEISREDGVAAVKAQLVWL